MAVDVDEAEILRLVGAAVVARREELGLSQRALATAAGLDRMLLRGVEDGSRKTTVIALARIARVLDTTVATLTANVR